MEIKSYIKKQLHLLPFDSYKNSDTNTIALNAFMCERKHILMHIHNTDFLFTFLLHGHQIHVFKWNVKKRRKPIDTNNVSQFDYCNRFFLVFFFPLHVSAFIKCMIHATSSPSLDSSPQLVIMTFYTGDPRISKRPVLPKRTYKLSMSMIVHHFKTLFRIVFLTLSKYY